MPPRNASAMTPDEREAKVAALKPAWAQDYIRRLEQLTRVLHEQLSEAHAAEALRFLRSEDLPPGITPPQGEYATARVYDHDGDLSKPLADLPERAEILFAGFYQVHYGAHEATAGARVLTVEGTGPLVVRPVDTHTILIAKG